MVSKEMRDEVERMVRWERPRRTLRRLGWPVPGFMLPNPALPKSAIAHAAEVEQSLQVGKAVGLSVAVTADLIAKCRTGHEHDWDRTRGEIVRHAVESRT